MNNIHPDMTVGQIVTDAPGLSRTFERLGIDYCCGGKQPIRDVCSARGISIESLLQEFASDVPPSEDQSTNWNDASLTTLAEHIESTHHAYLKDELPRLSAMLAKLVSVHGTRHAELMQISTAFEGLKLEMLSHMIKEEKILFPAIKALETHSADSQTISIQGPISVMEAEHQSSGDALAVIRELTNGFEPPKDACNTYRATFQGLAELEADLHQHIHKENNILFPRALAVQRLSS